MNTSYIDFDNDGYYLFQHGSYIEFTSDDAMLDFIAAMKGGPDVMISAMINNDIFKTIGHGDVDAATALIEDYFGNQGYFWIYQEAQMFAAEDYGGEILLDVLSELADFLWVFATPAALSRTAAIARVDPNKKGKISQAFKYFEELLQDPVKKAAWVAKRVNTRAKHAPKVRGRVSAAGYKQTLAKSSATWAITTLNITGGESLTFVGDLPYAMAPTYTILEQPERSFSLGIQTLAWNPSAASSFLYGGDGYCVTWKTDNGHSFAVNIFIPLHFFGIGEDAFYQVWYDGWGPRPDHWLTPPGGASAPYTFPGGWGYTVNVVPKVDDGKLSVEVTVAKETSPPKPYPCVLVPPQTADTVIEQVSK